jgi:hypothetical protein
LGFNATRRYRDAPRRDIALLVVGVLVIAAALAWAAGLF